MNSSRINISYGETLQWTTPAGASRYLIWAKSSADDISPRWVRISGFDITANAPLTVPNGVPLSLGASGFSLSWEELLDRYTGFDNQVLLVTAHDADGGQIEKSVIALPASNATDASQIASEERRVLKTLLEQRAGLSEVASMVRLTDPSGTSVERIQLSALDRRISEIRARIAWYEAASQGNSLPRSEHW